MSFCLPLVKYQIDNSVETIKMSRRIVVCAESIAFYGPHLFYDSFVDNL